MSALFITIGIFCHVLIVIDFYVHFNDPQRNGILGGMTFYACFFGIVFSWVLMIQEVASWL